MRSHVGVILVYGIDHREFDVIVRGIVRCLELYPDPASWHDLAFVVDGEVASAIVDIRAAPRAACGAAFVYVFRGSSVVGAVISRRSA